VRTRSRCLAFEHADAIKRAFHDLPLVGEIEHAPENLEFPIDARYLKLYAVARRDVPGNEFTGDFIDPLAR
jgi:hypothetical protein